jgi:hypothetical protein
MTENGFTGLLIAVLFSVPFWAVVGVICWGVMQ